MKADRKETKVRVRLQMYFKEQEARVLERLSHTKSIRKKSLVDDVFELQLEVGKAEVVIIDLLKRYLEEFGQEAVDFAGYDRPFILKTDVVSMLERRNELFAKTINKTTYDTLKKQFELSIENDETRDQLVKRIQKTYGDIKKSRAYTIARTETLVAAQTGKFEGYKQAGLSIKIWVHRPGALGGVRHSHRAMDGEEKPIDQPFSNGLQFPGEDGAPAEEVINCACTI